MSLRNHNAATEEGSSVTRPKSTGVNRTGGQQAEFVQDKLHHNSVGPSRGNQIGGGNANAESVGSQNARKRPRPAEVPPTRPTSTAAELLHEIERERKGFDTSSGYPHALRGGSEPRSGQVNGKSAPPYDIPPTQSGNQNGYAKSMGGDSEESSRDGVSLELFSGLHFMKPRAIPQKPSRTIAPFAFLSLEI